jgi:4'-phosphopantetheinyl transferase EntD
LGEIIGAVEPVVLGKPPSFELEASIVNQSAEKRRSEFSAGRRAAQVVLNHLDIQPAPLLRRADGTVVWPPGVIGSISHTATLAVAIAAPIGHLQSVGVDIEENAPLSSDLLEIVCRPKERVALNCWRDVSSADPGKLIFSAKEAFYKAYFPLFDTFLDFMDIELELFPFNSRFSARVTTSSKPTLNSLGLNGEGVFFYVKDHILTLFKLFQPSACGQEQPVVMGK